MNDSNSHLLQTKPTMASPSPSLSKSNILLFLTLATLVLQGVTGTRTLPLPPHQNSELHLQVNKINTSNVMMRRRAMIGSVKPTCTYNECRGCRSRCRAEQVPVEGNDPINSAYHYRCVCHRVEFVIEHCKYAHGKWSQISHMSHSL